MERELERKNEKKRDEKEVEAGPRKKPKKKKKKRSTAFTFLSFFFLSKNNNHASAPSHFLHPKCSRRWRPLLVFPTGRPPRRSSGALEGLGAGCGARVALCCFFRFRFRGLRVGHRVAGGLDGRVGPDVDATQRGHGAWGRFGRKRGGDVIRKERGSFF